MGHRFWTVKFLKICGEHHTLFEEQEDGPSVFEYTKSMRLELQIAAFFPSYGRDSSTFPAMAEIRKLI